MLDWDHLRYFLALAREGSLTRAASSLGVNPTTVGRRLTALEEQTGTRLFDRSPDGYALTQAGRDLMHRAQRMEAEALAVVREIAGADRRLSGTVRIAVTEMLATRFLAPFLPRFSERYPDIHLDLHCTTRAVSLERHEADIALRLARPREVDVVTRPLTRIPLALYAASSYLEGQGLPPRPEASLAGHRVLSFADSRAFAIENRWLQPRLQGARVVLRSDSVSSLYAAACAGLGIALLPRVVADHEPSLVRLDTESAPEPRVVWQTVHVDLQHSARIRAVTEFLEEAVGEARGALSLAALSADPVA